MNGILPLWKERGMTSHDCVFRIRKILRTKKVGHTGTLDPDVDGVLPICIGRATKLSDYIMNAGKTYEGEVTIGYSTTTEDASGDTVEQQTVDRSFTRADILSVLASLTGEISQTPPMYSAVKVKGKKLYEYARQGIEVERPSRTVTIHELELLDERELFEGETITFSFRAVCSKGTYIRTLAVMIGERLGFPAHMSRLTRTAS
ncbi:MAG TPA: tRNA pseudouridine(55) synthase TruB, partial [Chondromyces sp.]|nr:tRNA pseudouridine(55) synthase TruB [Chondromyces sp.]